MIKDKLKSLLARSKTVDPLTPAKNPRIRSFEINLPDGYGYRRQDRISIYRFLTENIPILNGSIWLWTRLCAAPVEFKFDSATSVAGQRIVKHFDRILSPLAYQKTGGIESLVNLFFRSLFIDGCFAGEVILNHSGDGIEDFNACDARMLSFENTRKGWQIFFEKDSRRIKLEPGSFYYTGMDSSSFDPRGISMLSTIGFISHLEQKLINDMSQSLERSGYQRVQVQLTKPEKLPGESNKDYIERANRYFDDTVSLMGDLKPADSAITWDDVKINTISPSGTATSGWYLYHRALVEDICAGMHLDPFMLGYSFGTTQTWAKFKFELMMRQIIAVQEKARGFLKWLLELEMALRGVSGEVDVCFDNRRVFGSLERYKAESIMGENIIEQYKAGLLDKDEAKDKLEKIEPGII